MFSNFLSPEALLDRAIVRDPLTIAPDLLTGDAIAAMNQARASYILVVERAKILGIFTERDVVRLAASDLALQDVAIALVMTGDVVTLSRDRANDIFQAIALLRSHQIRHLPIVDEAENLLGIVTPESIRAMLQPTDLLKMRRVADVIAQNVLTVPGTASVLETIQLMVSYRSSCVVIGSTADEKSIVPLGILTERDIVRFKASGLDLARTPSESVMSCPLLPVSVETTLWDAHEKMQQHSIRRLVVTNETGTLAGIVTQTSIVQALDPVELCLTVELLRDEIAHKTQALQQTNEQLQREIKQRQQTEEQLRHLNQCLEEQNERRSQELIQSEKMAALGQLMAGITHDLSAPVTALRSSLTNLTSFFGSETLEHFPEFFQNQTPEIQRDFWNLVHQSKQLIVGRSRREIFQLKKKLRQQLEKQSIAKAANLSDTLVELGIDSNLERFTALLTHSDSEQILDVAYQLVSLQRSVQLANMATEQASVSIFALKKYIREDFSGEKVLANIPDGMETILMLYQNAFKQGVELVKKYEGSLPEILCYPNELNQVWMNLVQNALYAMSNQGTLEISIRRRDGFVQVAIGDSGTGIPPELKEKIFQPFFTTKPLGEGSGLGLDIVKKIVDKHRGTIELTSVPGKTTFWVSLPIES